MPPSGDAKNVAPTASRRQILDGAQLEARPRISGGRRIEEPTAAGSWTGRRSKHLRDWWIYAVAALEGPPSSAMGTEGGRERECLDGVVVGDG